MLVGMQNQLVLLPPDHATWEIDDRMREVGRRGLEQARHALRQAGPSRQAA